MQENLENEIKTLTEQFHRCQKMLTAIGDETRQLLLFEMMKHGDCRGVRVEEIAKKSHLSRPAVSHHFQILKDAQILQTRKEGTKIYYRFNQSDDILADLIAMLQHASAIINSAN